VERESIGDQAMALWAEQVVQQALEDGVESFDALVSSLDIPEITAAFGELKSKIEQARALEGSRRVEAVNEGIKAFVESSQKAPAEGSQSLLQALVDKTKKD